MPSFFKVSLRAAVILEQLVLKHRPSSLPIPHYAPCSTDLHSSPEAALQHIKLGIL